MALPNGEHAVELLQAQAHVFVQIFNFIGSASLKCAIQLGIPDIIHKHGKPMTITELIDALPINKARAGCVPRLMRFLVHLGFFIKSNVNESEQEEVYSLTPSAHLLLKDEPLSFRPYLEAILDPLFTEPSYLLAEWFKSDSNTPFEMAHGMSLWSYTAQDPKMNHLFNEGLASDSRLVTSVLIRDFHIVFEGINSLVDVGGGTGTLAKAISEAFPNLECSVLDLPHVVDGLQETSKLRFVGGDMFDYIPPAEVVLLKFILHNWSDEECIKILKNCKQAISSKGSGGKVIILDMMVGKQGGGDDDGMKSHMYMDMMMMVTLTGRERNEKEWAKLFIDSGFKDYKIAPVENSRFLIEVYP